MKRLFIILALTLFSSVIFHAQCVDIEDLLSKMTLKEKIGQMTQVSSLRNNLPYI